MVLKGMTGSRVLPDCVSRTGRAARLRIHHVARQTACMLPRMMALPLPSSLNLAQRLRIRASGC
jgi:hypothetical protein